MRRGRSKAICRQLSGTTIATGGVCGVVPILPSLQGVRYHRPHTTATKLVCGAGCANMKQAKVHVGYDHSCNLAGPYLSHHLQLLLQIDLFSNSQICCHQSALFSRMTEIKPIYDLHLLVSSDAAGCIYELGMRQLTQQQRNKW